MRECGKAECRNSIIPKTIVIYVINVVNSVLRKSALHLRKFARNLCANVFITAKAAKFLRKGRKEKMNQKFSIAYCLLPIAFLWCLVLGASCLL
jgi:hypothetical protein